MDKSKDNNNGRVGNWRGSSGIPRDPVSSPRHITRSVRISRTTRSCTLHGKGYVTYRGRAAELGVR